MRRPLSRYRCRWSAHRESPRAGSPAIANHHFLLVAAGEVSTGCRQLKTSAGRGSSASHSRASFRMPLGLSLLSCGKLMFWARQGDDRSCFCRSSGTQTMPARMASAAGEAHGSAVQADLAGGRARRHRRAPASARCVRRRAVSPCGTMGKLGRMTDRSPPAPFLRGAVFR